EDLRERTLELPRREEEGPVDERTDGRDRGLEGPHAGERGGGEVLRSPLDRLAALDRDAVGKERRALPFGMLLAKTILQGTILFIEARLPFGIQERADDADDPRRVRHVDHPLGVARRDPNGCVLTGGRRTPDQEREVELATLPLLCDVNHLVQGRRDQ